MAGSVKGNITAEAYACGLAQGRIEGAKYLGRISRGLRISGHTLLELLAVLTVIAILAGILLPALIRGYHHAREWIYGVTIWHNSKVEVFLRDESSPAVLQRWATFGAEPWVIQKSNKVEVAP